MIKSLDYAQKIQVEFKIVACTIHKMFVYNVTRIII